LKDDCGMGLKLGLVGFKRKKLRLLLIRSNNKGSIDLFWKLKREGGN
jgi:hypothetical protein